MRIKTIFMLGLAFTPLTILCSGAVHSLWNLFFLYMLSGLGMAGIGMGIMHDAIHGSYSRNRRLNRWLGYTMNLLGGNAAVWRIQHNVLHHTYTNIESVDEDIAPPFFLRFSPHSKRYWIHRFQHLYAWFFYGMSTLSWVTAKDFVKIFSYRRDGYFQSRREFRLELLKLTGWKLVYYVYALVVPILMLPFSPWLIALGFVAMHIVTGLSLTLVFQAAHIMPTSEFPTPDADGNMDNNWALHQMATTTNFSGNSVFFSWFIGGLNYQIEHHLFPNVCHVHYRKLSQIVSRTAKEFGIKYHSKRTFLSAVRDHAQMLALLGKLDNTMPVRKG